MSRNAIAFIAVLAVAGFAGCAAMARAEHPRNALGANPAPAAAPKPNFVAPPEYADAPIPASSRASASLSAFQTWTDDDSAYRFFPGDEVEIVVRSAPELSRTLRIAPDGRITMPMIAPLMAADRTSDELTASLSDSYRSVLRDPTVEVIPRGFGSQQIFVAGEVRTPGAVDLNAPIDAFQAVTRAGGFLASARVDHVYILRRDPGGAARVYRADLSTEAFRNGLVQLGPLQRFDVVYVPRSPIAEIGLFMQQYVRDALPVNFSLFYDLRGENRR